MAENVGNPASASDAAGAPPFEVPVGTSPEGAARWIATLKGDKEFGARVVNGDKRAMAQLDALERHAVNARPGAATPEPLPAPADDPRPAITLDEMTPHQRDLHRAIFEPAKPEDYRIDHGRELAPDEIVVDAMFRGWLSEAGIPKQDGDAVAEAITRAAPIISNFSPSEREAYRAQTESKLQRIYGADAPQRLADAQRLIN